MTISELKGKIAMKLCEKFNLEEEEALHCIEYAKPEFAHLAIKVFGIAKKCKKDLKTVFEEMAESLNKFDGIEKIEFQSGYVNLTLDDKIIVESLAIKKNRKKKGKTVIEFPSVNPNKPWHIGHLRNALIGESISKILEFSGENVEKLDYINDLGLQVAESFYHFKNTGKKINTDEKLDLQVGKDYVEAHNAFEQNEETQKKVRETLKKMESGDENARKFSESVVMSQHETAMKYGVEHDALVFESDITSIMEPGLSMLKKNKNLELCKEGKNKGCCIMKINSENEEEKEKVLIRSDGTITYTGKDIIFHLWKFGKLKGIKFKKFFNQKNRVAYASSREGNELNFGSAQKVVNIVGIEQAYPQFIVKHALNILGYEKEAKNLIHLAYAFVRLKESRFSGRKGVWIGYTADDLLEEALQRIKEKNSSLDEENLRKIALSAIKFAFLRIGNTKEIVFDWDRVLSPEGDSGIYLLYSYVRALSVLKNASKKPRKPEKIKPEMKNLVLELCKFNEIAENSAKNLDTSAVANYLLEISKMFHGVYAKVKFLGTEEEAELVFLIEKYAEIMKKGMSLLGMETAERM